MPVCLQRLRGVGVPVVLVALNTSLIWSFGGDGRMAILHLLDQANTIRKRPLQY